MKREALLDAIWTGDKKGLIAGLAPLSEGERKALPGKELAALRTKHHGAWVDGNIDRLWKAFEQSLLGHAPAGDGCRGIRIRILGDDEGVLA